MHLIGLTGGIGSGKTMVTSIFKSLQIPVYESDERGRYLLDHDPEVIREIKSLLGHEAYTADNTADRKWIASRAFADRELLKKMNAIIHPAVFNDLKKWAAQSSQSEAPYLIQESAIFFEENLTERFDKIIIVVADEETRIQRVMQRDKVQREDVIKRMQHQWKDAQKIPLSDFVIYNDQRNLEEQVKDIDKMLRALYA